MRQVLTDEIHLSGAVMKGFNYIGAYILLSSSAEKAKGNAGKFHPAREAFATRGMKSWTCLIQGGTGYIGIHGEATTKRLGCEFKEQQDCSSLA